jgi:hypothetical protein
VHEVRLKPNSSPVLGEVPKAEGLQTGRDSKMEFAAMFLFELHPHLLNSLRDYVARPSSTTLDLRKIKKIK